MGSRIRRIPTEKFLRSTTTTSTSTFKGLDLEEKRLVGDIRINAHKQNLGLCGIHVPGLVVGEGDARIFQFDKEKVFFYGRLQDLYDTIDTRMGLPQLTFDPVQFKDREIPFPGGLKSVRYGIPKEENSFYYSIPMSLVPLDDTRRDMLEKTLGRMPRYSSQLFKALNIIEGEPGSPAFLTRIKMNTKGFPTFFQDQAFRKGRLYTSRISDQFSTSETVYVPKTRIISTPMGGLPEWARELWRHTRSN